MDKHLITRVASPGVTLPVPRIVQAASIGLGTCSALLGLVYLLAPPARPSSVQSAVAYLEPVLGWVFVLAGSWVVAATVATAARASAHCVAAVAHSVYAAALILTVLIEPTAPPRVAAVLSLPAFIAHGALSVSYWQRGYR